MASQGSHEILLAVGGVLYWLLLTPATPQHPIEPVGDPAERLGIRKSGSITIITPSGPETHHTFSGQTPTGSVTCRALATPRRIAMRASMLARRH